MRLDGELVQWNDARGFGFIVGADGKRYFVHISAIGRIATRPREGDRVTFEPHRGRDGRDQARGVAIAGANPAATREARMRGAPVQSRSFEWRYVAAVALCAALVAAMAFGRLPWAALIPYGAMGICAFLSYALDKGFAETGHWRISEVTLHGLDLAFGIVGGLLAQAMYRHKTRKASFVATTALIAGVHLAWLAGIATGLIGLDDFAGLFAL